MVVGQERGPLVPVHPTNRDQKVQMNRDQWPTWPGRPSGLTNRDQCEEKATGPKDPNEKTKNSSLDPLPATAWLIRRSTAFVTANYGEKNSEQRMFKAVQLLLRETSRVQGFTASGFVNGFSTAPNSQRLAGKVALITGAASGIGKAKATEFIRNGAKVIIADVQDDLGRSIAAELGPDAAYVRCDVSDEVQIAAAVDLAVERHGHLDVLYSNAGISGSVTQTAVGALDLADFDRVMAVGGAPSSSFPASPMIISHVANYIKYVTIST
ncbi:Sex determination protein tasselseed-2 [Triticum urartu]|uniref:Sex determination protein tasselseed-2 n=1 Tax=Triticum urartu TaxID=4572 RepID=M7ZGZ2_TRIUA|nr:Sex determination protein tasselseed-2 [Triticum urartu]